MTLPFPRQPVLGFSSLVESKGRYFALTDNGYAIPERSSDFNLRIYEIEIDTRTPEGGTGAIQVKSSIELRRDGKSLTGDQFDPESGVRIPDGTWWIGEEYGPSLLHFSADGNLLGSPFSLMVPREARMLSKANEIRGPDSRSASEPTVARSKGIESMVFDSQKNRLLALVEGPFLTSDRKDLTPMLAFDLTKQQVDTEWYRWYPLDYAAGPDRPLNRRTKTGEMCWDAAHPGELLVVETDDAQGADGDVKPETKKIYRLGVEEYGDGFMLQKHLVADLLRIKDPHKLASQGDGFSFPFATIESIVSFPDGRILVMNDNNFPTGGGRGRKASGLDDTEAAIIRCKER